MSAVSSAASKDAVVSRRPCPICSGPPVAGYSPFCSKRCADRDLHRWLGGQYGIPGEAASDEDSPPSEAEDES
jgi:uncharacterized protein